MRQCENIFVFIDLTKSIGSDPKLRLWGGGVNYPFNMALDLIYNQTKKAISSFFKAGIHYTTFKIWTDFF